MSNGQRIGILVAAVAALVIAFVALSGEDDVDNKTDIATATSTTTTPAPAPTETAATPAPKPKPEPDPTPTVEIVNGQPVDGIQKLEYKKGDEIRFKVASKDTSDEVHFHGYDVSKDLKAGSSVTMSLKASAEGIFEVELEGSATQIAEVRVEP